MGLEELLVGIVLGFVVFFVGRDNVVVIVQMVLVFLGVLEDSSAAVWRFWNIVWQLVAVSRKAGTCTVKRTD